MDRTIEMKRTEILEKVMKLKELHKNGSLGGEIMPEDSNPGLESDSKPNFIYFTLPMALNYQRNSYKLWESALNTYNDNETSDVFSISEAAKMDETLLREKLVKYKVALQPNKQPVIWKTLCSTFDNYFSGDIRVFFEKCDKRVELIKSYMHTNKKKFPYLSGAKILNYWLYVMEQYTSIKFKDRINITVAPDTHVIQASLKLGIINELETTNPKVQDLVSMRWEELLKEANMCPIDIHTPLWLWSRSGFTADIG